MTTVMFLCTGVLCCNKKGAVCFICFPVSADLIALHVFLFHCIWQKQLGQQPQLPICFVHPYLIFNSWGVDRFMLELWLKGKYLIQRYCLVQLREERDKQFQKQCSKALGFHKKSILSVKSTKVVRLVLSHHVHMPSGAQTLRELTVSSSKSLDGRWRPSNTKNK